jgi:hypothetical protein
VSNALAWFLKDGIKDIALRIATSATLTWVVVPRVPPIADAVIAFIVLSLLLGPVILGLERLLRKLQARSSRPRHTKRQPSTMAPGLRSVLVAIFIAALVAWTSVYLVGEQAAQRRVQEERREFAEKQALLQKERRIDERQEIQERQAIEASLARSRLNAGRIRVSTFVRRARREYWSWESLLLRYFGSCPETRAIMREVGHDIRNMAVAKRRVESSAEAKALSREVRRWIQSSSRNRDVIVAGAREFHPVRFVLGRA